MKPLSDQSLLDFAIDMFNEGNIQPQKQPISQAGEPGMLDISKINITNEQVENLLSGKPIQVTREKPITAKKSSPVNETITKRDLLEIIAEFKEVVSKASELIREMTTVGSIGVNMAPTEKKKPKKKKQFSLRKASEIVKETLR